MIYLVLKNNYVVNRINWDGVTEIEHGGDAVIEDVNENVSIGDWYEEAEGVFYAPRSRPDDINLPEELNGLWENI